ncbi:N-acetylgalactosamine-6-O-sulfatase [subsurface metagenome]
MGLDPEDPIEVSYISKIGDRPTGLSYPELLKQPADRQHSNTITNGISRIGFMAGGKTALWKDEDFPFVLTEKAKIFIEKNKKNPFFLYFSFHDIHVPRIPNEQFVGSSTMGPRGDVIAQMDWCTGEIVKYLEMLNIHQKTLIIFSSDNGPVLNDGYSDNCVEMLGDHKPSGPFRGGKYSSFEAGTRVPTISYWPGKIIPGESDALLTQVDLLASLSSLINVPVEHSDSKDHLDAWLGLSETGRDIMLEESYVLGLRKGEWKYIPGSDKDNDWIENTKKIESGISPEDKLYNLRTDPDESVNVAEKYPEMLIEMKAALETILGAEYEDNRKAEAK